MGYEISPIVRPVAEALKWFSETKVARNAGNNVYSNNRKYIDGLGVASIIAKDGLGCYLYVTQSLGNKDIPDDKRKFVAALDLTNGVLMIALQLLMFFTVSHKVCQTKMFDKCFGKLFDRPIRKTYHALVQNKPGFENIQGDKFNKEFGKIRENVKDAFGGLTSLVAATIVGKRMLVPFIATPLADKVEKMIAKKEAEKSGNPVAEEQTKPEQPSGNFGRASQVAVNNATPRQVWVPRQGNDSDTNLLVKYRAGLN